jgi:hypothetical protein
MKTAVEWLIDELYKQGISLYTPELIEQAKEMEQEQIMDAYAQGADDDYEFHINPHLMKAEDVDAEQYYNQNFKQQEQ